MALRLRHALLLTLLAFALHYGWENAQCSWFFIHADPGATQADMVRATVGDVAMTWLTYAAAAAVSGRWLWSLGRWGLREWLAMEASALVMSFAVETAALSTGRWTYTVSNPRIPGTAISALPVAQLMVLFPACFALCRWLLARRT
jgi:uncharacterized membrane protein (DUF2068 family)